MNFNENFPNQDRNTKNKISNEENIKNLLLSNSHESLSNNALLEFIPDSIYHLAENPEAIELKELQGVDGEIHFIVLEKNSSKTLTDPDIYHDWKNEIEAVLKVGGKMRIHPEKPLGVNHLHAKFRDMIDTGDLKLSDRIFMSSKLKISPDNKKALLIADYDGEIGKGIAQDFYLNKIPELSCKMNLRFVVGENNSGNISFFKEKLNRYLLSDLKDEYRNTLFPGHSNDPHFTIQFLYKEDIEKYVEKPTN